MPLLGCEDPTGSRGHWAGDKRTAQEGDRPWLAQILQHSSSGSVSDFWFTHLEGPVPRPEGRVCAGKGDRWVSMERAGPSPGKGWLSHYFKNAIGLSRLTLVCLLPSLEFASPRMGARGPFQDWLVEMKRFCIRILCNSESVKCGRGIIPWRSFYISLDRGWEYFSEQVHTKRKEQTGSLFYSTTVWDRTGNSTCLVYEFPGKKSLNLILICFI